MRALLAIVLMLTGSVALPTAADARKGAYYRSGPPVYAAPPRYYRPRYYAPRPRYYAPPRYYGGGDSECERRALAEDPTGLYAGYPCWAREAFGRTPGGRR